MGTIAWKNLFHDRTRLFVTLIGIVFALVLILVQFGLFLSFLDTSSNIVANSKVDLWISAPSIPHVVRGAAKGIRWMGRDQRPHLRNADECPLQQGHLTSRRISGASI